MNKYIKTSLFLIGIIFLVGSCKTDEIDTFSVEDSGIHFTSSLNAYSFIDMPDSLSYVAGIPVSMIGPSVGYDRFFGAAVDSLRTSAPADKYEVIGGIVKAGELKGTLSIRLKKSAELDTMAYKLGLLINPGDDFQIGLPENDSTLVIWDNTLPTPNWWYYRSFGKYVSFITVNGAKKYSVYSRKLYEIIIQVWGSRYVNAYGLMGTTPEVISKYPVVYPGLPIFSVMIRKLEQYVYDYNLSHPNEPLRHSSDAAIYSTTGAITTRYQDNPLIQVNPYNQ